MVRGGYQGADQVAEQARGKMTHYRRLLEFPRLVLSGPLLGGVAPRSEITGADLVRRWYPGVGTTPTAQGWAAIR